MEQARSRDQMWVERRLTDGGVEVDLGTTHGDEAADEFLEMLHAQRLFAALHHRIRAEDAFGVTNVGRLH